MTALSYDKQDSYPQENIYSIINNRSYVADPRNRTTGQFVFTSDPIHKGFNFSQFPYIVLGEPQIDQISVSVNGKVKIKQWTHSIIVRSVKGGAANNNSDTGKSDIRNISDDLFQTFDSETVKKILRTYNMWKMKLVKVGSDDVVIDQKKMYEYEYELTYETRMVVSL